MNKRNEQDRRDNSPSPSGSSRYLSHTENKSDTILQEKTTITAVIQSQLEVEEIPDVNQKDVINRFTQITTSSRYTGSLPPPEHLMQYDKVIPEGAERIMRIAEKDQEHRLKAETTLVTSDVTTTRLGQIFGLTMGMTIVMLGFICIMQGHDLAGSFMSGSSVVGLVSIFVIGRNKRTGK